MKNKLISEITKNFEIPKEHFEYMEEDIQNAANLISERIENNKRIIFVSVGSSFDIVRGLKYDLEYNFNINQDLIIPINAGYKYRKEMDNWKDMGDLHSAAIFDLIELGVNEDDLIIGLSSSADTTYTMGAINHAADMGADTILITNQLNVNITTKAKYILSLPFEHNIFTIRSLEGTTLMKMVLDTLLFVALHESGRVYEGYPVYMKWNSEKTKRSVLHIIKSVCDVDEKTALKTLEEADGEVHIACAMLLAGVDKELAKVKLDNCKLNFKKLNKI